MRPLRKMIRFLIQGASGVVRLPIIGGHRTTPSAPSKEASRYFYLCRGHPSFKRRGIRLTLVGGKETRPLLQVSPQIRATAVFQPGILAQFG